jgi:hypothetical protein
MEIGSISKDLAAAPIETTSATPAVSAGGGPSQVRVSEVSGTYFAEVAGPPSVTTSGSSLTGAEDRLAYLVNLFA